jgi:ABC-type glutathione transport system ATPase component
VPAAWAAEDNTAPLPYHSRVPALLEVRHLAVHHRAGALVVALDDATLDVGEGETVGLLGESGAGKTTLLEAVLGLLPESAAVARGTIHFKGRALLDLPAQERRRLLGAEIAFIPQDPAVALNPVRRIGPQVAEVVAAHRPGNRSRCREEAEGALAEVGLSSALYDAYPHQLSGGQRQRVTIAQALCCRPALVLADEPTAALDSATQAELRALLKDLRQRHGVAMLLVSHDVGTLWALADRVFVLDAGRTVESGPAAQVLTDPRHPYTRELLEAVPRPPVTLAHGG